MSCDCEPRLRLPHELIGPKEERLGRFVGGVPRVGDFIHLHHKDKSLPYTWKVVQVGWHIGNTTDDAPILESHAFVYIKPLRKKS